MKCVLIVLLSLISCQSLNERTFPAALHFGPEETGRSNDTGFRGSNVAKDSSLPTNHHQIPQQTQALPHSATLSRIVETKYGKVQGLSITLFPGAQGRGSHPLKNKVIEAFLSIPYASPPVKSHRFSPTQTPMPWDGVRTAVKPGFVCPQVMPDIRDENAALKDMPRGYMDYIRRVEPYLRNQSEDCLYLNIFSPVTVPASLSPSESKTLKPVLVFIHGGKFSWGSGNLVDGTLLAAYADFLFVSLNYRLGVLGFLNVNAAPTTKPRVANYGLMDQIAALHWIKENIVYFGGDAENVTLMGYEAGAACIHFLMSSPAVMPGLFHRSILIAGSAFAPWALVDDPSEVAAALAASLNCSTSNSSSTALAVTNTSSGPSPQHMKPLNPQPTDPLFDCLKNKHFSYFSKFHLPKFAVDFGPSIDGIVIRPNFRAGEFHMGKRELTSHKYDLLFGLSALEMLTSFAEADLAYGFEAPRRDSILRTLIRNSYRFHLNEILATVTNEYIDWERSIQHPVTTRDLTLNAVTDSMSLAPVIAAADSQQIRKSFFYVFEHSTKDGLYAHQRIGAGGGEELNYFLGSPLIEQVLPFFPTPLPSNYTKSEMALSELLIVHLSNFVRTGDPNEPNKGDAIWPLSKERNKFRNSAWESYDRLHQKYLEISVNKVRIRSHYRAHQMAIWLRLVPELQRNGMQYIASAHNRMKGGNDPTLYVGNLRLPQLLEAASEHGHSDLGPDFGDGLYNGSGIPPSPPTTCFSPLSSISSSSGGGGGGKDGGNGKETSSTPSSLFSTYTTALSLTIGLGCCLLILNVFIFAVVYYRRDKKRSHTQTATDAEMRHSSQFPPSSSAEALQHYSIEGPELLKSNSTTATSFHQSASSDAEDVPSPTTTANHSNPAASAPEMSFTHREVHFSPRPTPSNAHRQSNHYQPHHHHAQQYTAVNSDPYGGGLNCCHGGSISGFRENQLLGVATLPRFHSEERENQKQKVGGVGVAESNPVSSNVNVSATLPKKPTPPTRNFSNYTISQRQIFSLIMSLLSFGIL